MLEQETAVILEMLTNRTIAQRDRIAVREILAAEIPRGIKVFIRAEVLRWLRTDLYAAPRFARVDFASPGTEQLTSAFLRSLGTAYSFPRDEYLTLLENAVNFLGNYVCRPQWTLEQFIYEDRQSVPDSEVFEKLEYTADYAYFSRLIGAVIRQQQWKNVTREDFRLLILKIDDQIVKQHSAKELGMLAKPIFDFLVLGNAADDQPIPLKPVLAFFDDKRMKILKEYIDSICRLRNQVDITLHDLIALIEDLYLSQPKKETGEVSPIPTNTSSQIELAPTAEELPDSTTPPIPSEPPPEENAEVPPPAQEAEEAQTFQPSDRARQNIPLSLTYAGMQESPSYPPLIDLHALIPEKDRVRYIRRIFRRDKEYFDGVITSLNGITTWKEASLYLNKLFEINNLDPFSQDVIHFTDVVQRRYPRVPKKDT